MTNTKATNKKKLKPSTVNLIALFAQILISAAFVYLYMNGMSSIYGGNLSGGFSTIIYGIWFMYIAIFIVSMIYLFVKPMRTVMTIIFAIWNLLCVAYFIYVTHFSHSNLIRLLGN